MNEAGCTLATNHYSLTTSPPPLPLATSLPMFKLIENKLIEKVEFDEYKKKVREKYDGKQAALHVDGNTQIYEHVRVGDSIEAKTQMLAGQDRQHTISIKPLKP